jgi:hypothetical protein
MKRKELPPGIDKKTSHWAQKLANHQEIKVRILGG